MQARNKEADALWRAMMGDEPEQVPHQELFWHHPPLETHLLGHPATTFEDEIQLALQLGWGSVNCGWLGWVPASHQELASDGQLRYAGGLLKTWADLERLQEPDLSHVLAELPARIEAVHRAGLLAHIWVTHCFHSVATSMGLEWLAIQCYDNPAFVEACMERIEDYNRRTLERLLEQGIRPDFICYDGDCAFKTGLMVSPNTYRQLTFERTRASVSVVHDAGIPLLFHTDGKVDDIYPILIDWGFSASHGVEAQANDLAEVKRRFGSKLTLFGNFDPVFLATATPKEIRAEARRMVTIGMAGGRYVAAVNTIVREYVPIPNYLAFLDTIREISQASWL